MTVDSIIETFTLCESFPAEAIAVATERREEILPRFLKEMDEVIDGTWEEEVPTPVFLIFHLLGSWHERRAYRTMARLLAVDPDRLGWVFGDSITETVGRVMAAVYDGDPQPLFDLIGNEGVDEYIRQSLFDTLVILVRDGRLDRDRVVSFLAEAPQRLKAGKGHVVWVGVQQAVALLGAVELKPMVERLFREGWVGREFMDHEHFLEDIDATLADPAYSIDARMLAPFGALQDEIGHWNFGSGFDEGELDEDLTTERLLDVMTTTPVVNPYRGVGRNDPCPCGSGKKFKKCHGAS